MQHYRSFYNIDSHGGLSRQYLPKAPLLSIVDRDVSHAADPSTPNTAAHHGQRADNGGSSLAKVRDCQSEKTLEQRGRRHRCYGRCRPGHA